MPSIGGGIGANITSWLNRRTSSPGGSPFNGHATLTNGLVSAWKMNEESGARIDVHGSNDLADNNTVGFAAGKNGNAASFVAASNQFLSSGATFAAADSDFTVVSWVNPDTAVGSYSICNDANGDFLVRDDNLTINLFTRGFADAKATTTPLVEDQWNLVVAYHDAANNLIGISINGGAFQTGATGGANGAINTFFVGARADGVQQWNGLIDQTLVYTRVLTAQEVTDLYAGGAGLFY